MARRAPVGIGLPQICDGHQFRVAATTSLGPIPHAFRVLLIEDAAATVVCRRETRLAPPALVLLPPGSGGIRIGRGGFCYRFDLDAGPALGPLLRAGIRWWQEDALAPWRSAIVALAQRWWRSLDDRRRVAVALTDLLVRATSAPPTAAAEGPLDIRFHALVREHVGSGEGVGDLARRLGVSRITLDRALRRGTGRTAADWLRSERLHRAADLLLRDGRTIAEIGAACGFADPDSFARAFRGQYGCTPRAWRRRHG